MTDIIDDIPIKSIEDRARKELEDYINRYGNLVHGKKWLAEQQKKK